MFKGIFKKKKILITGNTGFKGSWLSLWLNEMGAQVYGYSIDIPTSPSLFLELKLNQRIEHKQGNVCNYEELSNEILTIQPDFIFHLAAQSIVSRSFQSPVETFKTNVIGTANVLECVKKIEKKCVVVIVTSDKCYRNDEWIYGYRETDYLGGHDPYSASKAAAELVFHTYYESFFKTNKFVRMASARAGNVIGGGDWTLNRIVPDCFRAWSESKSVEIRNPHSTRPWQHVLEPLSGYLHLAYHLSISDQFHGQSYNFGPRFQENVNVQDLIRYLAEEWSRHASVQPDPYYFVKPTGNFHEAGLLKLCIDKATGELKWFPVLPVELTTKYTAQWYWGFYNGGSPYEITKNQLNEYMSEAKKLNIEWSL